MRRAPYPHGSPPEKTWAILGITRKRYAAAQPWKKTGTTEVKYAEMLNLIPHEVLQALKDDADAEKLMEGQFSIGSLASLKTLCACLKGRMDTT